MAARGWDAGIITGSDPHSSEYPAPRWQQVEWFSGFTGEAGDLVITADHAGLWTDTRYFIQADRQLRGSGIALHKTRIPEQVLIPDWIAAHFESKDSLVIAVDGLCQQVSAIETLRRTLAEAGRTEDVNEDYWMRIVDVPDLPDLLWSDRPAIPSTPVTLVPEGLAGESRSARIEWLRSEAARQLCDAVLITSLDEIAWLLNVRGSDIEYNPMVISYLLVREERVSWFVRKDSYAAAEDSVTLETFAALEDEGIEILPYDELALTLNEALSDGSIHGILTDPATLNWSLWKLISESGLCVSAPSPVQLRKAVKNATEIEGFRRAHLLDGIAMEQFLWWLETTVNEDKVINERTAAT